MQKGAVSVEASLIEKKARLRAEKRVTYRDDNIASMSDPNYDRISKGMEKLQQMMEKMVVTVSNQNRSQNHNQNQNFRRNNTTPNRQRESDQQVIPPFQENFLDEDEGIIEESEGNTINMFETENSIHNCYTEGDQPSPSYWDEERLESKDYRLDLKTPSCRSGKNMNLEEKRA